MQRHTEIHWVRYFLAISILGIAIAYTAVHIPAGTNPARQPAAASEPQTEENQQVEPPPKPVETPRYTFIEVIEGCGPYFEGACINVRSGPGTEYPSALKLRNGMVLRVIDTIEREGRRWYKLSPGDDIRHPERVTTDWYVAADFVRAFEDDGDHRLDDMQATSSNKEIIVNRTTQKLYAYDGDTLFMEAPISTGLELTPTPRGRFTVYKMMPSRYMQGPIPGITEQFYDLPGVPWNLYFTKQGAVIHGAYWHDHFGEPWSHGCVNLPPETAKTLYMWAELGTKVIVRD